MALHPQGLPDCHQLAGIALCAGVGGLELGLHIAEPGYRTVCYVERESAAASTLVARMEDQALDQAPIWSDLTTFDGRPWRGKVRIVTAGYPCQPFSSAGLRRGTDDPRHLWPHVARIAQEADAEWLFCENVEGHVSLGLSAVLADLSAMGFSAKAGLFSAAEVGASHLRRRIFILAHSNAFPLLQSGGPAVLGRGDALPLRAGPDGQTTGPGAGSTHLVDDGDHDPAGGRQASGSEELPLFAPAPFEFEAWQPILDRGLDLQPELFGLDHGVADRVDRSNAAGNGVVSLAAAYAYRTLRAAFG